MRTVLFNIKEETVAARLGLTREAVRELREHLTAEEDYATVGREIAYTEDGIKKIREVIKKNAPSGVKIGDVALLKVTQPAAGPDAATVILDAVVTNVYVHNKLHMEALLGGQTILIRLDRTHGNVNFLPGMVIESRQLIMRNLRLFDFVGRYPRSRGKW
jgi:hypothetical protein